MSPRDIDRARVGGQPVWQRRELSGVPVRWIIADLSQYFHKRTQLNSYNM